MDCSCKSDIEKPRAVVSTTTASLLLLLLLPTVCCATCRDAALKDVSVTLAFCGALLPTLALTLRKSTMMVMMLDCEKREKSEHMT